MAKSIQLDSYTYKDSIILDFFHYYKIVLNQLTNKNTIDLLYANEIINTIEAINYLFKVLKFNENIDLKELRKFVESENDLNIEEILNISQKLKIRDYTTIEIYKILNKPYKETIEKLNTLSKTDKQIKRAIKKYNENLLMDNKLFNDFKNQIQEDLK